MTVLTDRFIGLSTTPALLFPPNCVRHGYPVFHQLLAVDALVIVHGGSSLF
jgi:hypothetical protein